MGIKYRVIVREDAQSRAVSEALHRLASHYGFTYDEENPDYVFSIGGDGTFLKAVHLYLRKLSKINFVGIHTGSLGFFADFRPDDLNIVFTKIKMQEARFNTYRLVKAEVIQNNRKRNFYAVNEVRIENVHHTLVLDVTLNDDFLEKYRGNGVLVATQLGSSGYNKSLGGAIINRDLPLLEYTKIAPIANSVYRPLVNPLIIGDKDVLTFKGENNFTFFGYDSLTKKLNDAPFTIKIFLSNKKVKIMHRDDRPYTQILNETFLGG
ncbi:MAG: NAD(+)/NADH kinase [Bacilli bacterium]